MATKEPVGASGNGQVRVRWQRELVGDPVIRAELPSGLVVYVVPKAGFRQQYAVVGFRYGSMDSRFVPPGQTQVVQVPDGIAHFLEHKLFEKEDGDVFSRFAQLGASSNAYTGYSMTAYLCSAVERFGEALELLLRFVQLPYFTEASVHKEQGIIEQELRMYEDDPGRCVYVQLLQALYHVNPVRLEIGGTVESIRQIRVDTLYLCHRTFYRPDNAALAVVGGVDPEQVLAIAAATMGQPRPGADGAPPRREYPQEPEPARQGRVEKRLAVSRPRLLLGIKDVPAVRRGRELVRRDLAINIALEAAFGKASDHFRNLYEDGLIDDGFSAHYFIDTHYAHSLIGGETSRPEELERRLRSALARLAEEGVPEEDFERLRRREMGEFIAAMDNPEMVANSLVSLHFREAWPGDYLEVLAELTREEVNRTIQEHVAPERVAVSIILPAGRLAEEVAGGGVAR